MTQMDDAKKGIITEQMKAVAKIENVDEVIINGGVVEGSSSSPSVAVASRRISSTATTEPSAARIGLSVTSK